MEINKEILKKHILKNVVEFMLLGLIIYLMRDLFNLFLFTFLFSYLIYNLQKFIVNKTHLHKTIVTILLYFIIIGLIGFFICKYIPEIIKEVQIIFEEISKINVPDKWVKYINSLTEQIDIEKSYDKFMNTMLSIGKSVVQGSLNVFISLVLSMFFVLDKEKITKFIYKFKTSKISCIYNHFEYFGTNFLNSFGKVIQAQFLIALANSFLSIIALYFMGFPQLMGLGFMIFILSFIPVAGTIISLIPLSLIAFNIGGLIKVISVIIMIALIHCFESYVLNPKLMSDKTSLPIFFIFIILIAGKYFMGVWGLLLGIPLFIFILDILNVKVSD
ncbi:AI-2E family transporter [Clostridium sp. OS1-26]|uniref:AI-2E family transporter n=1 Tax=Clostridium sp. OS1-26 TaxID=3070681 RepID=UPI0027DFF26F|nr:AI-2E family transporter [Clostridium sp. OS1-26]WML37370.1 AI-2E family transporter [Clostridium sp. OS1-26]